MCCYLFWSYFRNCSWKLWKSYMVRRKS